MFRAHRAHHQEREIVSIQPLVAVTLCRWLLDLWKTSASSRLGLLLFACAPVIV